jgi:hypothetical protein
MIDCVIQRAVHDRKIISIGLYGDTVHYGNALPFCRRRFHIACKTRRDERDRHQSHDGQMTKPFGQMTLPKGATKS